MHVSAGFKFMNNQPVPNHVPVTPSVQGGAKGERITALDRQVGRTQRSTAVSCEMQ